MHNYSTLGYELSAIISEYRELNHNQHKKVELCSCDSEKGLKLEGSPIFANTIEEGKFFWEYGTCHLFPRSEELVALTSICQKSMVYACGLVLKGAWEKHVADSRHWQHDNSLNVRLNELLEKVYHPDKRKVHVAFTPDTDALYHLLVKYGFSSSPIMEYREAFSMLIHEMLLNRLYLDPIEGSTFSLFIDRKEDEMEAYQIATPGEIKSFHEEKYNWLNHKSRLGEYLLRLENNRIANEHLKIRWLAEFGKEFMEMEEEFENMALYEQMRKLKLAEPDLLPEHLHDLAAEQLRESEDRLKNLGTGMSMGLLLKFAPGVDEAELAGIKKGCEELLRKISLLTHPDRLAHNSQYLKMTEGQQRYVNEMFLRSREIKKSDSLLSASKVCWSEKNLLKLRSMLYNIEEIYTSAGIDANVAMMIKGETLAEKIAFLKQENQLLAKQIAENKSHLVKCFNDREVMEKHQQLGCPELYDRIKETMLSQAEKYRHETSLIQDDLRSLFAV
jgi:hypothetical protein